MAKIPTKYQCSNPHCQNGSVAYNAKCVTCKGKGWNLRDAEPVVCAVCEGYGELFDSWMKCTWCWGRGYKVVMEEVCDEGDVLVYYINGPGSYQVIPGVGVVRLS